MSVPRYSDRNRSSGEGGPRGVVRSSASQHREFEPLFTTYEHLQGLPRADSALDMLRKVASLVKPIMRKRGWRVQILAEFLPQEQNLLGLNVNRGYKICIRLRYHNNPDLFLPLEEVVDTMLHELSHNVWGDHDSNFHALWEELRDEHEVLVRKGYTGEGFLGEGRKLGGRHGNRLPQHEMRRLARASAEKRKETGTLMRGSGQKLGGTPLHHGQDVRQVIVDRVTRRNAIDKGCASGREDAGSMSDRNGQQTFKTKAEEDDANDRAISQALYDLIEEEEDRKMKGTFQAPPAGEGLAWNAEEGLHQPKQERPSGAGMSAQPSEAEQLEWAMQESMAPLHEDDTSNQRSGPLRNSQPPSSVSSLKTDSRAASEVDDEKPAVKRVRTGAQHEPPIEHGQARETPIIDLSEPFVPQSKGMADQWACEVCTCINPMQYLACDACGVERPEQKNTAMKKTSVVAKGKPAASLAASSSQMAAPLGKESLGWGCHRCGAFMEHKWWTCSACGTMKASS